MEALTWAERKPERRHTSLTKFPTEDTFSLIHLLASGVFFSGFVKDLLCLPRPLSPPLRRITMSGSAALEYGFPSTHTTNALSVVMYSLLTLQSGSLTADPSLRLALEIGLYVYAASIILGRLYCGMHGFVDVLGGGLLGATLALIEFSYGEILEQLLYSSSYRAPLLIAVIICTLVRIHPEPADDCPCFDDSVAFAGVMIGVEFGNWHFARTGWSWNHPVPATAPFDLQELGWLRVGLRIMFGVLTIFVWRGTMKPILLRYLPPLFRVIERLGLSLPRRFFMQASYVDHNIHHHHHRHCFMTNLGMIWTAVSTRESRLS